MPKKKIQTRVKQKVVFSLGVTTSTCVSLVALGVSFGFIGGFSAFTGNVSTQYYSGNVNIFQAPSNNSRDSEVSSGRTSLGDLVNSNLDFSNNRSFRRGDANADGTTDISDFRWFFEYLAEGRDVPCLDALDVNDDGQIDYIDPVYWSDWLYKRATPPPYPGPYFAGIDPSPDSLTCESY